jgi:WD40 repeat protein
VTAQAVERRPGADDLAAVDRPVIRAVETLKREDSVMRRVPFRMLVLCLAYSCAAADVPEKPILVLDAGGHTALSKQVLFTRDSKQLISVSRDKTIRFWDVASGRPLRVLRLPINEMHGGEIYAAALAPDGQTLAAGGTAWRQGFVPIYIIDIATGHILRVLRGHANSIAALAFSPTGERLASGSYDRTARIWNVASGQCERILEGHEHAVRSVSFGPDGRRLATASYDKTGRIWSVEDGRCDAVLGGQQSEVQRVAWRPDGQVVTTGGWDGKIRQWLPDGSAVQGFKPQGAAIFSLVFSADSRTLLFTRGHAPFTCSLLNAATGEELVRFDRHTNSVLDGTLSPDGTLAATTGFDAQETFIWRLADATVVRRLAGRGKLIHSVAWGDDGDSLAWGNTRASFKSNDFGPLEHTFRPGDLFLSDGLSGDVRRGTETLGSLKLERSGAAVVVKEGANSLAAIKMTFPREPIQCYTLLPGERVAVGDNFALYLFDARSGRKLWTFAGAEGGVLAIAPSPDGRYLLAGCLDQTLRVWNLALVQAALANDKTAGIGISWSLKGQSYVIDAIRPDFPASQDRRLKVGDRLIAIAQLGEGFVELEGKERSEVNAMLWGVANTKVRIRVSRDGSIGASEYEFVRQDYLSRGTSTPILSIFVAGNDWVTWTPEGYYAASPGGEQLMGWHLNNGPDAMASYYPASQFRKTLYRPDVIKRLLGTGSLKRALAEADAANGKSTQETEVAEVLPPKVTITSPTVGKLTLSENTLEVKAVASSVGNHPVTTLRLLLDGRPAPLGLTVFKEPRLGEVRAGWTLEIPPGSHHVTVQASNAVSKAVSGAVEVVTVDDAKPAAPSSSLYVLAVGINDYPDKRLKLDCAAPDAQSLRQTFVTNSGKLFREVEVKLLLDRQATRANILDGLRWLAAKAKPGDVVVVFYAGHGDCKIEDQFYLLPVDANLRNLSGTGISGEALKRALADLPSTTMLVLDACYAGSFDGKKRKKRALPEQSDALLRELTYDAGLVVMCGASKEQEAAEEDGHGFFTQALVEGLSGKADMDKDGLIELNELDVYVTQRVRKLSAGDQEPTISRPSIVRSFALSKP